LEIGQKGLFSAEYTRFLLPRAKYIHYIHSPYLKQKKMLRVKDVEKLIDRDRNTILRWEREGKIPHPQKDSRGWRYYTESDIQVILSYLKNNNPCYNMNMHQHNMINNSAG